MRSLGADAVVDYLQLAIVASLLIVFRRNDVRTTTYVVLTAPIALQELVLALCLVNGGFNPSALGATS